MLNIFVCLLLAHVLSDFVLQNNFMYKLKIKSKIGIFFHVGIFFLLAFVLLFPVSLNFGFFIWLLLVSVTHYFIDKIKLFFQRNIIQKELSHFFIDQALHVLILSSMFFFIGDGLITTSFFELVKSIVGLSNNATLMLLFTVCFSVYVSYGISVILYYYDRTVDLRVEVLRHDYFSMFIRVCIFLMLIGSLFWVGVLSIVVLRQILKKRLVYDGRRFTIEHLTLFIFIVLFFPVKLIIGLC